MQQDVLSPEEEAELIAWWRQAFERSPITSTDS
jgi:hypothetical protein